MQALLDLLVQISAVADVACKSECIRQALPYVAALVMRCSIDSLQQHALNAFSKIVQVTGYVILPFYEFPELY